MKGKSIRARAPAASSAAVRRVMQANYGDKTRPETVLRSELHRRGLRFYKNHRPIKMLRCTADIVFPSQRLCIFVDGCFWHGCLAHFKLPVANRAWWKEKIDANRHRDETQTAELRKMGWKVFRIWEHELDNPTPVAERVIKYINKIRDKKAIL